MCTKEPHLVGGSALQIPQILLLPCSGELEEPRVLSSQELQDMFPGSLLAERLQEQAAVKGRPD